MAVHTGPHYPNKTTPFGTGTDKKVPSYSCSNPTKKGCLFRIVDDPFEMNDLGGDKEHSDKVDELLALLVKSSKTYFNPDRGPGDKAACVKIKNDYSGFFGPWLP